MNLMQSNIRSTLLAAIPKIYQNRAESLLKIIAPHMKVSPRGEIIDPRSGTAVENTRLDDLIQYAVGTKRRVFVPKGWIEFMRQLRTINVPTSLLNPETIMELQKPGETRPPPK